MSSKRPPESFLAAAAGRPGDDERDFEHVLAVIRRFGFSFGHLQNQIIVELWRLVCSAPSVPSHSQSLPVISRPLLERNLLNALNDRLRKGDFSRSRVRSVLALILEACFEPLTPNHRGDEESVLYRLQNDINTLQDMVRVHNEFLKKLLQKEGIGFTKSSWSTFLLLADDEPPSDEDGIGLSRKDLCSFRTSWCSTMEHHPRNVCSGAHQEVNMGWLRRNPFFVEYSARRCPRVEWEGGRYINNCRQQALCTDAHSPEEISYHPDVFKTRKCKSGMACPHRSVCPFLHTPARRRDPEDMRIGGCNAEPNARHGPPSNYPSSAQPSRHYSQPLALPPNSASGELMNAPQGGNRGVRGPTPTSSVARTGPPTMSAPRTNRRSGLPRLLSELRRYGMDILAGSLQDYVLNVIYRFFTENKESTLTHREITYRLHYRLLGYTSTMPGLDTVSRTKLRGVLALLKTIGVFKCSKENDEALTTMAVRPELTDFAKFKEMYDLGILAYASYANIVLNKEDLETILDPATMQRTGIDALLPSQWSSTMQEYEERLAPSEPFWKLLNEPKAPAPTSTPVNSAQHGALLERSAKMFERTSTATRPALKGAADLGQIPPTGKIFTNVIQATVASGAALSDAKAALGIRPVPTPIGRAQTRQSMHQTATNQEPEHDKTLKTKTAGSSSSAVQVVHFAAPGIICYNSPPRPEDDIGRLLLGFISIKTPPKPLCFPGEQAQ